MLARRAGTATSPGSRVSLPARARLAQLQDRCGVLGLGAALHGGLDPLDDVAVAVRLQRLELQLIDVLGKRPPEHGEEVVSVRWDLASGPSDLRDRLGHLAGLGLDRLLERLLLDREA